MLNVEDSADVGRSRVGSRLSSKKEGWRLCSAFWRMLKFDTPEFLLGAGGWLPRCCGTCLRNVMGSHQLRAVFVGFGGMALRGEARWDF